MSALEAKPQSEPSAASSAPPNEAAASTHAAGFASFGDRERFAHPEGREAAEVLVRHLFAPEQHPVAGIAYAIEYRLAEGHAGGDLVDVYAFDNDSVAFTVADIAGKGTRAAVKAALIKYGLRAYASEGFSPERVVASLDRLYLEHNAFEQTESFATVFFGHVDADRSVMSYTSAGHESVILIPPGAAATPLEVTAPAIGLFPNRQRLFKQHNVALTPGTLLVAVTDGITESRRGAREFFGMERLLDVIRAGRDATVDALARTIVERALGFSDRALHDDIAVLAVRINGSVDVAAAAASSAATSRG